MTPTQAPSTPHIVIIGNGMVGHHPAKQPRTHASARNLSVTVLNEEPHLAYDRVHLSNPLDDPRPDLSLAIDVSYREAGVTVVQDPAIRTRLRTFVNSDARDDGVQWVDERGQIRPADNPHLYPLPLGGD